MKMYMWIKISQDDRFEDGGVVCAENQEDANDRVNDQYGYSRYKDILVFHEISEDQVHPHYCLSEEHSAYSMREFLRDETKYWGGKTG